MEDFADFDAATHELVGCRLDVADDEVQAVQGARRHRADPRADGDRARGARRDELHDAEIRAGARVDEQFEAGLVDVEVLRAVDVADGDHHELERPVHGLRLHP